MHKSGSHNGKVLVGSLNCSIVPCLMSTHLNSLNRTVTIMFLALSANTPVFILVHNNSDQFIIDHRNVPNKHQTCFVIYHIKLTMTCVIVGIGGIPF